MRRGAPGIAPSWAAACRRRRGRASSGVCAPASRGALVERRALRVGWRISRISRALWRRPARPRVRRIARGAPRFATPRARIRARRARATPGRPAATRASDALARATASRSRVPLRRGLPEQGGGERRHRAGYLLREGLRDAARDPRRGGGRRGGSRRRSRRDATDHRESARSRRDRRRRWRGDINLAPRPRLELCEGDRGSPRCAPRSSRYAGCARGDTRTAASRSASSARSSDLRREPRRRDRYLLRKDRRAREPARF